MVIFLQSLLILALIFITVQDFRHRAVFWILFPILFVLNILIAKTEFSWINIFNNLLINNILLLLHVIVLTIYFSLRNRKYVIIINRYIGLGDLLMLLSITALFTPIVYIVYVILSLTLSLIYALFMKVLRGNQTIPLAGIMSLALILFTVINIFYPVGKVLSDM